MKLDAMKAVYCYYFPEVAEIDRKIHGIFSNKEMDALYRTQTPVEEARRLLQPLNLTPELDIPDINGKLDLDAIHKPIIRRVVERYSDTITSLDNFGFSYPTAGSSEGIFHVLSLLKTRGINKIYIPKGEYEGYKEYGSHVGINTEEIELEETDPKKLEPGFLIISNPSARNGNKIKNEVILKLCDAGHRVALDLAYVGSTRDEDFNVSHPNIPFVFLSWSKPYGLFRSRLGITFSREQIPSLYANKWFKQRLDLMLFGLAVVEEIGPHGLYHKYRPVQERIVARINEQTKLGMKASDALLLGYLTEKDIKKLDDEQLTAIQEFRRGKGARFCLTPYYEQEVGPRRR